MIRVFHEFAQATGNEGYFGDKKPNSPVYDRYDVSMGPDRAWELLAELQRQLREGSDPVVLAFHEEIPELTAGELSTGPVLSAPAGLLLVLRRVEALLADGTPDLTGLGRPRLALQLIRQALSVYREGGPR